MRKDYDYEDEDFFEEDEKRPMDKTELKRALKKKVFSGLAFLILLAVLGGGAFLGSIAYNYATEHKDKGLAVAKVTAAAQGQIYSQPERYGIVNNEGTKVFLPVYGGVEKNTYDFSKLTEENGYRYYTDGSQKSKLGIDVSHHNGSINWTSVKNAGIDFAMIRVGARNYADGTFIDDRYFVLNMQGAQNAGIEKGVYFYSAAINTEEAKEEAKYVIERIKNYQISYPVVFDTELADSSSARANNLSIKERTDICIAFCEAIKEAGYEPMIYANERFFALNLDLRKLTDYKLWLAAYKASPEFKYHCDMWQYSSSGKVSGISGSVDLNILFPQKAD